MSEDVSELFYPFRFRRESGLIPVFTIFASAEVYSVRNICRHSSQLAARCGREVHNPDKAKRNSCNANLLNGAAELPFPSIYQAIEYADLLRSSGEPPLKLRVKGKVRYKRIQGFGPFKKTVWEEGDFDVHVTPNDNVNPVDGLKLVCSERDGTISVDGSVKEHPCYFGSVSPGEGRRRATFIMTSVRNIEVRGEISLEE